jgi:hypothetical protein
MTAPTAPFTTTAAVIYLLASRYPGRSDFDANSTPLKTFVTQHITWIDSQIQMQFSMAGYMVPLDEISGETWPAHQTTYLQLISTLGAAAMAGGHALRPSPALSASQGRGAGNIFQDLYQAELDKIYTVAPRGPGKTFLKFRANYYAGSIAEEAVTEPKGPTTDFLEAKYDPYRQLSNWDVANKVLDIQRSMADLELSWDYLYGLFDLDKGFATSIYET